MTNFDKIKKSVGYDEKTQGRKPDGKDIPFTDAVEAIEKAHEQDIDPRNNRPRFWGVPEGYTHPLRVVGSLTVSVGVTVMRVFDAFLDSSKRHRPPEG